MLIEPASKESDGAPVALPISLTAVNVAPSAIEPPPIRVFPFTMLQTLFDDTQSVPVMLNKTTEPEYVSAAATLLTAKKPVVAVDNVPPDVDPPDKYPVITYVGVAPVPS